MNKKPCSQPPGRKPGWPDGPDDVINKYGTYEVQVTCGGENDYPMIAQGQPWRGVRPEEKPPAGGKRGGTLPPER